MTMMLLDLLASPVDDATRSPSIRLLAQALVEETRRIRYVHHPAQSPLA
jgi:hypothetical protein